MKKTILVAFLVLFTVSCASFTEWAGSPEGNEALTQTAVILALANETPAVRNDYLLSAYYYPPLMLDHYVPPNIWREWSPLQRSLWIRSAQESDLRDYEYKIKSINDMQMFQMKLDVQGLIDDIKREREKTEDKRSGLDLNWLNSIPPKKVLSTEEGKTQAQRFINNPNRKDAEAWWKNFRKKWNLKKD